MLWEGLGEISARLKTACSKMLQCFFIVISVISSHLFWFQALELTGVCNWGGIKEVELYITILFRDEGQIIPTTKTISVGMEEGRGIATMSNDKCSYYILENFLMAEIFLMLSGLISVSGNCFIIFLLHSLWHSPKDCQMLTGQQFQILKKKNRRKILLLSTPSSWPLWPS